MKTHDGMPPAGSIQGMPTPPPGRDGVAHAYAAGVGPIAAILVGGIVPVRS